LNKQEEIKNMNDKLSNSIEYTKKQIQRFESKKKEDSEKEIMNSLHNLKIKEYTNLVKEFYSPVKMISRVKSIEKENNKRNKYIIDITSPKKYGWELKLGKLPEFNSSETSSNSRKSKITFSPVDIRTPMQLKPDYLTEARHIKNFNNSKENSFSPYKEKKWKKMLNEGGNVNYNIENIKMEAKILEEKAKMKEQLLRNIGGTKSNPEISKDVSDMLVGSIKAKLAILNKINQK
jgi:hypothetical protein